MEELLTREQQESFILSQLRLEFHRRAQARGRYVTQRELEIATKMVMARTEAKVAAQKNASEPEGFSFSRMVRGLLALKHRPLDARTAHGDAIYVSRALNTGTTPGSYLVPILQARAVIGELAQYSSLRAAGATLWPVSNVSELKIPGAVTSPTFTWMSQNSQIPASDPNFSGLDFVLKSLVSLSRVSLLLFANAVPSFDVLIQDFLAFGMAETEDTAFHASSTLTNAPLALMSKAGTVSLNAASNNANGGNLLYSDLTAVIEKAVTGKARLPYSWFGTGRTWLRLLNLISTTSQPLIIPDESIAPQAFGTVFGFPYFSSSIPTNEAVGSGTNQSHLILGPPKAIHICDDSNLEVAVATEAAGVFENGQVDLRIHKKVALDAGPSGALVFLKGIN